MTTIIIKFIYELRVSYKLIKRRFFLINSFCRVCGSDVRDFRVHDDIWGKVKPLIKNGNTLCYDCFCDKCEQLGINSIWRIVE